MSRAAPADACAGTGLTRRTLLAAALPLAGCGAPSSGAPRYDGGWVGAAHERGHRLRDAARRGAAMQPSLRRRASVAIVGAGIAGLAAARALDRAGIDDVQLIELEDEAGGNSRGHAMAGIACPLGAHYLPLPGPHAHEVSELLHEFGLLRSAGGRVVADERHLCHSPQERLWIDGQWHEGLLPPAPHGSAREAQYRHFAHRVDQVSRELRFALPSSRAGWSDGLARLDALSFADWLDRDGVHDPALRWYLDYACRDDYGAGAGFVSAWAGLHYFASRRGFAAPGDDEGAEPVLTWPEGNAWLVRRVAAPFAGRLHTGRVALRASEGRDGVTLDVWSARDDRLERWSVGRLVLAVPLHAAVRIVDAPSAALRDAAARLPQAPWLVANLHLREPLVDKPGAPPSWDNVLYDEREHAAGTRGALGYVDAMHQSFRPHPGPTVLTAYWALGGDSPAESAAHRARLLDEPWSAWSARVIAELARAHPDLPQKVARVDLMRYGHAMAIPAPGVKGDAALSALAGAEAVAGSRVHLAHADLAGYSVFEEAFHHGHAAGVAIAKRLADRV